MKPLRIVYAGPALAGKTMNLHALHRAAGAASGNLVSLVSETDRSLVLKLDLPCVDGTLLVCVATVPGAIFYNQSRIENLRGVDGIVFVADGQPEQAMNNRHAAGLVLANLERVGRSGVPIVLQANKQDIPGCLDAEVLEWWLAGLKPVATIDARAFHGVGVLEPLRAVLKPLTARASEVRWDLLRDAMRERYPAETDLYQADLSAPGVALGDTFRALRSAGQVQRLRIRDAHVLPPDIGSLRSLEYLDLQDNELPALPAEIGRLDRLRTLRLRRNSLPTLPPEIGGLTSLSELWLDGNRLDSLPDEIGALTSLQLLSLDGNSRLETLPGAIGHMRRLKTLLLRSVPLDSLPDTFVRLSSLETLWMEGTRFTRSPQGLGGLAALRVLALRANQPPIDATSLFRDLATSRLSVLDLSNSGLGDLPAEIALLTRLTFLDLSGNAIRRLPDELRDMERLSEITLELEALDADVQSSVDSFLPRWPRSPNATWSRARNPSGSTTFSRNY